MNYLREQLLGQWYRLDIDEKGQQISEYAQFFDDGRFEFTFSQLNLQGCVIQQTVELGDWGVVGDIHFTITKSELVELAELGEVSDSELTSYSADLTDADNYHAYRMIKLTSTIFEYQHILTNEVFIMRRVIDNIGHC